ncbi:Succinate dehydrogenase iron-sulfur protein [Gulosibacter sp. 10]|nr:Succinate dehydrogenase iron-sulfur protein [Gulosibacter sp. 10]
MENKPEEPEKPFKVEISVRRYDPEQRPDPYWETFEVDMYSTDRILDALHRIKWDQDSSLAFRRSCAHGICGSDAMRINGRNRLACKTLIKDLDITKPVTVEAIKGLPLERDLIVDMDPFFEAYKEINPFLVASDKPEKERIQSVEDRAIFDDTTKCILCAACTTSCPVFWTDGQYFGPAAIVNAHRFIFDSRDEEAETRLDILNDKEGVWRCRTTFNCTEACPRGIEVTKAIAEVKQAILRGRP